MKKVDPKAQSKKDIRLTNVIAQLTDSKTVYEQGRLVVGIMDHYEKLAGNAIKFGDEERKNRISAQVEADALNKKNENLKNMINTLNGHINRLVTEQSNTERQSQYFDVVRKLGFTQEYFEAGNVTHADIMDMIEGQFDEQ